MTHALPMPTLDHVVINARDRLDQAADTYARLGFSLTPRGHHSLGSMNHLAMFGTDYLELIAIPPGSSARPEIMAAPLGLNGLVFGTEDASATHQALCAAGVAMDPPQSFSRPVEAGGQTANAAFTTTHLARATTEAGRVYFCQHQTRHLVWRDEWRHHANGAVGIVRAVISAENPASLGAVFRRMFGATAVRETEDGCAVIVGLSSIDIVTPGALWEMYGTAGAESRGRREFMAALTLRTRSLDATECALQAGGIKGAERIGASILVPANQAMGTTLEFTI